MKLLFDDKLAPMTAQYGFVEGDITKLVSWFQRFEESHQSKRGVTLTRRGVRGPLEDMLHQLEPLTSVERRRYLFVPTRSSWVATSTMDGRDPARRDWTTSLGSSARAPCESLPSTTRWGEGAQNGREKGDTADLFLSCMDPSPWNF